ncbi:MAG: GTPase HflX [Actinobacteria bacterium]|nr:GTPase HflX [Actinomycetota bacterium]
MEHKTQEEKEKFITATIITREDEEQRVLSSIEELESLIDTAGGQAVFRVIQRRDTPDPKTYIGRGKAKEIGSIADAFSATALAIDARLSASQMKNLEEITGLKVLDRTAIILDIFATHARSLEGKLQVELAQLTYLQSRLIGRGTELSRLGGGIGTRGPGETKLEVDRRRIKKRIQTLRKKLYEIEKHRTRIRNARKKHAYQISLVGYTNAGKSTLLNALTTSSVLATDQLFATLDPTVRKLNLKKNILSIPSDILDEEKKNSFLSFDVVISDTVGFIDNLPTELIVAFHSTLEEIVESDLLLHVIDASNKDFIRHLRVVEKTLEKIGAANIPRISVFNKVDAVEEALLERLKKEYSDSVFISALKGKGLEELKDKIAEALVGINALKTKIY